MKPRQRRASCARAVMLLCVLCYLLSGLLACAGVLQTAGGDHVTSADPWDSQSKAASVSSTAPPNATNASLPFYGDGTVPGVSLNGIYCVDTVQRTAYIGADVISVFQINAKEALASYPDNEIGRHAYKQSSTELLVVAGDSVATNMSSTYSFTQVGQIVLDGWATGCLFANRYELYLSVVNGSTSQRSSAVNAGASRMHYAVVHRYLRTLLRTVPLPESAADQAAAAASASASFSASLSSLSSSATTEQAVSVGPSTLLRRDLVTAVTSIVTPYWQGYLVVHHLASPYMATRTVRVEGLDTFLALTYTVAGDGGDGSEPMLFAIGFASSGGPGAAPPSHAQLADAWDIVGLTVDSVLGNADPVLIVHLATTVMTTSAASSTTQSSVKASSENLTDGKEFADGAATLPPPNATVRPVEQLARCYRAAVQAICPDCVPVALTHSRGGLFVIFVGQQKPSTYLAPIRVHTKCTMGAADNSASSPTSTSSTASSTEGDDGENIALFVLVDQICNISGLVADDYAPSSVLVSLSCQDPTGATVAKVIMLQVSLEWWLSAGGTVATSQVSWVADVLRSGSTAPEAQGSPGEAIARLTLANGTRLVHLALRQLNGAVTLLTYPAFGLNSATPRVVNAAGGSRLTLTGYGMVPGMRCVFAGSLNDVVSADVVNASLAMCNAPPLSETSCVSYPLGLQMSYETVPWAVPSTSPRNSVLSSATITLVQMTSPSVDRAVLEETGAPYAQSGTNATVLVNGTGFMAAIMTGYTAPSTVCRFWSPSAPAAANVTVPAFFRNVTTVSCSFEELPMLPPPSYISLSNDGTVFTTLGAPFASLGSAVAVELEVRPDVAIADAAGGSGRSTATWSSEGMPAMPSILTGVVATMPTVVSGAKTLVPMMSAFLLDNVSHRVPVPAGSEGTLLAFIRVESDGVQLDPKSAALDSSSSDPLVEGVSAALTGAVEVPFDDNGTASFAGLWFSCPPVGVTTLCVVVVNASSNATLSEFDQGCMKLLVVEGRPQALTLVQEPSTTYHPDWPLLSRQPIIGVRDECLNVFRSISSTTLPGDVTVQLYAEPQDADGSLGEGHSSNAAPYGPAWTAGAPIQNLFYVTNLSMPVTAFNMRYYFTVSADLPEPQTWSGPIKMLGCEPGRRSVLHPAAASSDSDGSNGGGAAEPRIDCDPCPVHGVCNGTSKVVAENGYWRANATSVTFVSCRLGHGAFEACANDSQCNPGYEGLLCGTCAEGYHTRGRVCRKCQPHGVQVFVIVLVAVAALAGLTSIVVGLALIPPSPLLVVAARTLLLSVQVLSLFSFTTLEWPNTLNVFFSGLRATADFMESLMSCYLRPSGFLVFLCCTPLLLIPLVTLLAGLWLRLLRLHRISPASMCAVVLTALLHRKQERFHVLRHTVARELWEPSSGCDTRPSTNSANDVRGLHSSSSPGAGHTPSGEWTVNGGDAAPSTPLASSLPAHVAALQASLLMGSAICADSAAAASMASTSVDGTSDDMEAFVLRAFGRRTVRAVAELSARLPGAPQERVVAAAMQAADAMLFEAVSNMSIELPTRAQVLQWTGCALDVAACLPPPGAARREAMLPSTKSGSGSPDGRREAAGAVGEVAQQGAENCHTGESPAMLLRWRRVGMVAAYRAMAVQHFRTSWIALLLSAASVTMICLYLNLLLQALLWQRCVSLGDPTDSFDKANAIPYNGAPVLCSTDEYAAMRKLGIAAIAVYGVAVPLGFGAVAMFLKQRYGKDVAHAALPVMSFGDTSFDLLVSLSDIITKFVSTIAVAVARVPLLQVGVLIGVFGASLIVNSVWRAEGHFFEMRIGVFSVALRRLITAARVIMFVVSNLLLLLAYLLLSGSNISDRAQSGLAALVCLGIILALAIFFLVSLQQLILHLDHVRNIRPLAERREGAERAALQALMQRYREVGRVVELYLQACDRGLLVAQKLDALSRMPALGEEDVGGGGGVTGSGADVEADDDDPLSFSSLPDAVEERSTESPHLSRNSTPRTSFASGGNGGASAFSTPHRRRRGNRRGAAPTSDYSLSDSQTSATTRPEALTNFPSYPELDLSDTISRLTLAPSVVSDTTATREQRAVSGYGRRRAARMSAGFRSLGPRSRRQRDASTAVVVSPGESEGQQPSAHLDLLSLIEPATAESGTETETKAAVAAVYPAGAALCEPVDGNEFWVTPSPRTGGDALAAEKKIDAAADAVKPAAPTAAATALSPTAGPGATPSKRNSVAGETHADRDGRASPMRDGERHPTAAPAATASTAPGPLTGARGTAVAAAHPLPAALAGAAAALASAGATATPPSAWSDAFAGVPPPAAPTTLRRSDSLVLSIRSLEAENASRVQTVLAALVEKSRAAAARPGSGPDPTTVSTAGVEAGSGGGSGGGRSPSAPAGSRGQQHATDAAALIDHYGGGGLDLDLASSFDPLAVPPLPLTRALTRTVVPGSTSLEPTQFGTSSDEVTSLMAALQADMDAQLRLFNAVDVQNALPELDLGSLTDAASLLQQIGVTATLLGGGGGGGGGGVGCAPPSQQTHASTPSPQHTSVATPHGAADFGPAAAGGGTGVPSRRATSASGRGHSRGYGASDAAAVVEGSGRGNATAPPLPVFRAVSQRPQRHYTTAAALPTRRRAHRQRTGAEDTRMSAAPSQAAASSAVPRGGATPSSVEVQEPSTGKRGRKP